MYSSSDIKPENIFVRSTEPGDIALGDFEASEQLWDEEDTLTGIAGTIGYASPEAIGGGPHNRSTDIWSIGIVAYALLAGRLPFGSNQPDEILTEMRDLAVTRQYDWPPFPDALFSDVSDIGMEDFSFPFRITSLSMKHIYSQRFYTIMCRGVPRGPAYFSTVTAPSSM